MRTVGIYVQIPFCLSKCYYCDFVSFVGKGIEEKEAYLAALVKEGEVYKRLFSGLVGKTLYIGGGTPTCLSSAQLLSFFAVLLKVISLPKGIEITVEANPGTVNKEKLLLLKDFGCNRLSLGVQSFALRDLRVLGRIHSVQDVYNIYKLARKTGFTNINLDLMYGLPGQNLQGWRNNLQKAVELYPEHISLYQLQIEKDTPYAQLRQKGLLEDFSQDDAFLMYVEAIEFLEARGYCHYEISNFALPGKEAVHNSSCWRNEEYLGLGAGACGYLEGIRYINEANLAVYRKIVEQGQLPLAEREMINRELAMAETMFLGLRLRQGVKKTDFQRKYGITIENKYQEVLVKLKKQGLLCETLTHVVLTKKGLFIANQVFQEFL